MASITESFSSYARYRGVSQPYISKLVKIGKIPTTADGKIDREAADQALADSVDPRMSGVRKYHADQREKAPPNPENIDLELPAGGKFELMTQTDAQTAKLQIQAKRENLAYMRDVREVIEIALLRKGMADLISVAAEQLRTVADRLAARLAAETDPRRVRDMLDAELLAIQQQIADGGTTLLERLTATSQ